MPSAIKNVPTTIISGFLGVGKTTAILNLFSKKPETEKWAVLVNEFGKVGIDGQVYQANNITVKEIPGGCMCCAQGLPLQVAVNQLLRETRPQRLLIESSGVGHPAGVLKTLKGTHFKSVLSLKAGICLLDPEHLINPDYQNNELFNEQLQCADILVANKTDLACNEALQAFTTMSNNFTPEKTLITNTTNGRLKLDWLNYDHQPAAHKVSFTAISNRQEQHWQSHTFHYPESTLFDTTALQHWLSTLKVTRLKGLIQGVDGFYLVNSANGKVNITAFENQDYKQSHNYIEVIDTDIDTRLLESVIKKCILH